MFFLWFVRCICIYLHPGCVFVCGNKMTRFLRLGCLRGHVWNRALHRARKTRSTPRRSKQNYTARFCLNQFPPHLKNKPNIRNILLESLGMVFDTTCLYLLFRCSSWNSQSQQAWHKDPRLRLWFSSKIDWTKTLPRWKTNENYICVICPCLV